MRRMEAKSPKRGCSFREIEVRSEKGDEQEMAKSSSRSKKEKCNL